MSCGSKTGASDGGMLGFANVAHVILGVEENIKKELTEALQRKRCERAENEQQKSILSIEVKQKELRSTDLKSMNHEGALLARMKDSEDLKLKVATQRENLNRMLNDLEEEVRKLSSRFATAQDRYHIQKISEDISVIDAQAQEIKGDITNECDPQIANSEAEIQKEPVTLIEVPGSVPTELSSRDLEFMISELKDSTRKFQQKVEELKREKEELEKREASL